MTTGSVAYDDAPGGAINQRSIFFASFMTLIAAGIGFAVRGGVLADWGAQFGFTQSDLGVINGAGLAGFGFTIIFFSFFADNVGYRALLILAFLLLLVSAVVTLVATPVFHAKGQNAAYWTLYIGTFIFSIAQGLCEAAINPLTATLYPRNKTHYLNILHAGWPGGLVIGSLICYLFATKSAAVTQVRWEVLSALYLVPTLYFGLIVLKNRFPISEARAAGVSLGQMVAAVFAPVLILIFILHAMVGYVELGTDGWIQNIMNNTIGNKASLLLAYTSILMFILRFFAGPIVHRINPLGLLFVAACCGALGLYLLGTVNTGILIAVAATIFALGKTFYWPTMLGVIGERFPRGGAVAMGLSGGIGMLSAGFLGGPGIGYTQDRHASANLQQVAPDAYERVKAEQTNHFLFFQPVQGLDGAKVAVITEKDKDGNPAPAATLTADLQKKPDDKGLQALYQWYTTVAKPHVAADAAPVGAAVIYGGRKALRVTSAVPVAMAVGYLLLVVYFVMKGGYKAVHLDSSGREVEVTHDATHPEAMTGGVPAPVE
jgi:MFS family permease